MEQEFDIIVVGAGHAGCEAALVAARMGVRVLLTTLNADRIGYMSCNPAIGGIAKGQLVKEVDALGGEMGTNTDRSGLQFRVLNASKGPAVQSSRAQCDKYLYSAFMKMRVEDCPGLTVAQREVVELLLDRNRVSGVKTSLGEEIRCTAVVVTTGTFLGGKMHTGEHQEAGGRSGDTASNSLSGSLLGAGLRLQRLKTGTPPRLERKSIDFSALEVQEGDASPKPFSIYTDRTKFPEQPQISCWITHTNALTHEVIAENFGRSPMFTGTIKGVGPRYCPSIEDKVKRFADKERHQIFLEPEGLSTREIYANGLSTSLPLDVQLRFLRTIRGLENVQVCRPGYAVEYDCIDPSQLKRSLEAKDVPGLFCGGQINGTSGYEEAAAQGLLAGINAVLHCRGDDPLIIGRNEGYIGVLVDDLILKGADEPYRMFTSRAEYRLHLREDNAFLRLGEIALQRGLVTGERRSVLRTRLTRYVASRAALREEFWNPTAETNATLFAPGSSGIKDRVSTWELFKRPEISLEIIARLRNGRGAPWIEDEEFSVLSIEAKYEGYLARDMEFMTAVAKNEMERLPLDMVYRRVGGLSSEVIEKLERHRPETLGQALRIPGVTPAAGAAILMWLRKAGSERRKDGIT